MRNLLFGLSIIIFFTAGCGQVTSSSTPRPSTSTAVPNTAVVTSMPTSEKVFQSSGVVAEIIDPAMPPYPWPAPMSPLPDLVRTAVTDEQQTTWQALNQTAADRDDAQLAQAYQTIQDHPAKPTLDTKLTLGAETSFNISQHQTNTVMPVHANLLGISDHAYFWFDSGPGSVQPSETAVAELGGEFDEIYEQVESIFGQAPTSLEEDTRVHIVTVSPLALCNVTLTTTETCGLAGYFNSTNALPVNINPNSNERFMFVMNADWFGTEFYLNVLTHEFRHLIEERYDPSGEGWEIEGSATLAEDLLGFPANAQQRANRFLRNPNLQLNYWANDDAIPRYGQGYLFNRYIYDQLGPDFYREFAQHPANGLQAIDAVAAANDLSLTGESLWLDWLAALAVHNHPNAPLIYQFGHAGLNSAATTTLRQTQTPIDASIPQYAANYYQLPGGDSYILEFTGSTAVAALPVLPVSGQMMWLAERGNFHNPRLTRTVDLTSVDKATLEYSAYVDMEHGYDFGYVAVSTDNGRHWQPLTGAHMNGRQANDDPAQTALADRFYTGRTQAWLQESIDLTPFVGQPIQLRFEYVTDPATNHSGFALDNIAIPEIGFYDDTETLAPGWSAEGFTRATAYIPQSWHLQLITFPDDIPQVSPLPLSQTQTGSYLVETKPGEKPPILIVAASAPNTLQPAHYQLSITQNE